MHLAIAPNAAFILPSLDDDFVERNGIARGLEELNLLAVCEQRADRDRHVTLSERRDRLGSRLTRIAANQTRTGPARWGGWPSSHPSVEGGVVFQQQVRQRRLGDV